MEAKTFALLVKAGPLAGQRFSVLRPLRVGRLGADLTIDHPEVSRRHAEFRPVDGALEVEDLGSRNGTLVNGRRIDGPTRVSFGDQVGIGQTLIEVVPHIEGTIVIPLPAPQGDESAELSFIRVLEGSTFMISDPRGDIFEGSSAGLFHEDTRYLNRFVLTIDGMRPFVLTSAPTSHYSAAFFLANPELPRLAARTLSIQRFRFVGQGLQEVVVLRSHVPRPTTVELRLSCGADFADIFEVKGASFRKRGTTEVTNDPERSALLFDYRFGDFSAAVRVHSSEPAAFDGTDLVFRVELQPRGTWKTRFLVSVAPGKEFLEPITEESRAASRALNVFRDAFETVHRWKEEVPALESPWDQLELVYEQSVADLAALRLHANVEGNSFSLPAAGLPWFMAIFGRDTLITSYQSLLVGPELARGALRALASLQGKESNDFKDEDPGKILHEIRFGELTVVGDKPHRPYYGTVDATPLFLVLLSEYWRITADDETCRELWPNAVRALEWIDRHGDFDGDGYVEYRTRSPEGLRNQGWKDSWDGVMFHDGTPAEPPIALCEVQGYAYDAKTRIAEIAERVMGDAALAARLRAEAAALHERFNRDFWIDERGGYYAQALDADKRKVDALTSNVGHLLWSGIVPQERAAVLVRQLFSPALFSGWGVRTMSEDDLGYNPMSYHDGTLWPHDNSLICAGLARYGYRQEANRIAVALLEAAGYTEHRLPEVFAGYARAESQFPVRYPTASSPQAWATAAPFLWLRLMLGLDVADGRPVAAPTLPPRCGRVAFRGFHALGARWDVVAEGERAEVSPSDA